MAEWDPTVVPLPIQAEALGRLGVRGMSILSGVDPWVKECLVRHGWAHAVEKHGHQGLTPVYEITVQGTAALRRHEERMS